MKSQPLRDRKYICGCAKTCRPRQFLFRMIFAEPINGHRFAFLNPTKRSSKFCSEIRTERGYFRARNSFDRKSWIKAFQPGERVSIQPWRLSKPGQESATTTIVGAGSPSDSTRRWIGRPRVTIYPQVTIRERSRKLAHA